MKLRTKITILALAITIVSTAGLGYLGFITARKSMEKARFDKLTAIREMKSQQIEGYFENIYNQVITFSENLMVVDAMETFNQAHQTLSVAEPFDAAELESHYETVLVERLNARSVGEGTYEKNQFLPREPKARYLQGLYLSGNPYPVGEKDKLRRAEGSDGYNVAHGRFHPVIQSFLKRFGYYDIFLVEPRNGIILYSVYKEVDFATSLLHGPYANSNIAKVFRKAMAADNKDAVFLVDFQEYIPSYNAEASFIASPIFKGQEKIGVAIFQMPIDRINDIMTSNQKWSEVGLGKSGETYIVGDDFTLRNQSRFLIEDKENYFSMIENIGVPARTIERIRTLDSTIRLQRVETEGTQRAINGESNTIIFPDYRGVRVLSSYRPLRIHGLKWVIMSEIDESEAFQAVTAFRTKLLLFFFIIAAVATIASVMYSKTITQRLSELITVEDQLSRHDFDSEQDFQMPEVVKKIATHRDEIGKLSQSFVALGIALNRSVSKLKQTTSLKERMQAELNIGRDIQMSMLPLLFPAFPDNYEFSIFSLLRPAREVGGDFFDFFFIDDVHFAVIVGDVSGKGVPAALFMAVTKTLLKSKACESVDAADALRKVNEELSADNPACMFVTAFIGVLNIHTGEFQYSNAGHPATYVKRPDSLLELGGFLGPILGIDPDATYESGSTRLSPGDTLVLYTDGVTESMNASEEEYSDERLKQMLEANTQHTARGIIYRIIDSIESFAQDAPQNDDITIVALSFFGVGSTEPIRTLHFEIAYETEAVAPVLKKLEEALDQTPINHTAVNDIIVSVDELIANCIMHNRPEDGSALIDLRLETFNDKAVISVEDTGQPFNPFAQQIMPRTSQPLKDTSEGGLGIRLVSHLVDKINYTRDQHKNIITLIKYYELGRGANDGTNP